MPGNELVMVSMGEGAWRIELPLLHDARRLLSSLRRLPRVTNVVITEAHAVVLFDPAAPPDDPRQVIAACSGQPWELSDEPVHNLQVAYDGADLESAAGMLGIAPSELVARHCATLYRVTMLGFMPGFAYLGPLDPRLKLPRLPVPRVRVPAGSVGIAGERTGVYPRESPGGWHLIGTLETNDLFDIERGARLQPGDRVRFVPVVASGTRVV